MNECGSVTDRTLDGFPPDIRAVRPHVAPRPRWTRSGSARWTVSGAIQIDIENGSYAGRYQIDSSDANALLVLGEHVPLTVYLPESKNHYPIGSVRWSRSRRMLLVDLCGSTRCGTCQIPAVQLVKHYFDEDDRPVDVVVPPERSP